MTYLTASCKFVILEVQDVSNIFLCYLEEGTQHSKVGGPFILDVLSFHCWVSELPLLCTHPVAESGKRGGRRWRQHSLQTTEGTWTWVSGKRVGNSGKWGGEMQVLWGVGLKKKEAI